MGEITLRGREPSQTVLSVDLSKEVRIPAVFLHIHRQESRKLPGIPTLIKPSWVSIYVFLESGEIPAICTRTRGFERKNPDHLPEHTIRTKIPGKIRFISLTQF
jgi:hypothetical protein